MESQRPTRNRRKPIKLRSDEEDKVNKVKEKKKIPKKRTKIINKDKKKKETAVNQQNKRTTRKS